MGLAVQITSRIKQHLKLKGITYRQLANKLDISEAAVKRAFSEHAFSLKRIEQICQVLSIDYSQLLSAEDYEDRIRFFNEEQEFLMASDEKLMCFFYLLTGRQTLAFIEKRYKFSAKEIDRYLLKLDAANLIRLHANRKFKLLVDQDFHWPQQGLLSDYHTKIRHDFVNSDFSGSHDFEVFTGGLISEASLSTARKLVTKLESDLRDLIQLDTKFHKGKLKNVTFYSCFRPWSLPLIRKYRRKNVART